MQSNDWDAECRQHKALIELRLRELSTTFSDGSDGLGAAMRDSVLAPGKRFRGVLTLILAQELDSITPATIDAACALEMVHAASLVVDDLPAMDGATLRRGKPATHRSYGEGRAILAGIALVTEAMRMLASLSDTDAQRRVESVEALARCIGPSGLCAGQELDLYAAKTKESVTREQDLKTSVLFIAGIQIALILNRKSESAPFDFVQLGQRMGRAFQSYDDLLDVSASGAQPTKTTGLDQKSDGLKKGIIAAVGLKEAATHYLRARDDLKDTVSELPINTGGLWRYIASILPLIKAETLQTNNQI